MCSCWTCAPIERRFATRPTAAIRCLGLAQARARGLTRGLESDCCRFAVGIVSYDAIAQGNGKPQGREVEIADLLAFIKRAGVENTVWITADMHYTAAHYYDPNQAVFQDFTPFWEFVSGPIHAGTWAPGQLDNTFGPRAVYQKGCSKKQGDNLAPCFGLQFFGHVSIDGDTEAMTVTLKDVDDHNLWATTIEPVPERWSGRPSAPRT